MIIFSSSTVHPLQYFLSSPILARLALKIKTKYFHFHQGLHPSLPPQVHSDLRQSLRRHPLRSSPWQVLSSQQRHGLLELLLLALNPVLEDSGHNSGSGYPTFGHPPPTHHFLNLLGDDALGSVDHVNYLVLVGLADQKGDSKLLAALPTPSTSATLLSGADRGFPGVLRSSANVM